MRWFVQTIFLLACLAGGIWVMFGSSPEEFWMRGAIGGAGFVVLCIIGGALAYWDRVAHRESAAFHCRQRGYRYREEAPVAEYLPSGSAFFPALRIEDIAEGEKRGSPFAIFDLTYEIPSGDNTPNSETVTIASAPLVAEGASRDALKVAPIRGLAHVLVALGALGSARGQPQRHGSDSELTGWFAESYSISWPDEAARARGEQWLRPSVLNWLRDHPDTAFEVCGGRLLLWRSGQISDLSARESLIDEALQLAELLSRADSPTVACESAAIALAPPRFTVSDLMWPIVAAAFGSWLIACCTGMALFFVAAEMGALQGAPLLSLVGLVTITVAVWIGSGIGLYNWIRRWRD